MELFSPRLRTLELQGGYPPEMCLNQTLLGRLTRLSIQTSFVSSHNLNTLLSAANKLEHLIWDGSCRSESANPIQPSSESLYSIILINSGLSVFESSKAYANVVDLEIRFTNSHSWPFEDSSDELNMPLLATLILEGRWGALKRIRALDLVTLQLRCATDPMEQRLEALRATRLTPQILRVDHCIAESELVSILGTTWRCARELHLTLSSHNDYLREAIISYLSGEGASEVGCPKIHALTVLLVTPDTAHSSVVAKMSHSMEEIAKGRQESNLELLRCGWVQWAGKKRGANGDVARSGMG